MSEFYIYAIIILLLIINVVQSLRISKLNKRFNNFISFNSKDYNIEEMLLKVLDQVKESKNYVENYNSKISGEINTIKNEIINITQNLELCIQKTAVVRYSSFENVGGQLCFALALLDKNNDGTVINTIYTEGGCYTYCKPVKNCKSTINLSKEEIEAIELAKNGESK